MDDVTSSYDEMVTGSGGLRPHWRGLMQTVSGLTGEHLAEKQARLSIQIDDADAIVNAPERTKRASRRSLDLLPLILPDSEWRRIAAGLVQRARLLNALLADLYGPQRLIADRLLPPYLALGNPAFLRPLRHVQPSGGAPHLYVYAADLVRLPDGEWRAFSDRTQATSGVGYALHNRMLLARALPELFRTARVADLQPFIELWRSSLRAIGARLADAPQIVLLTPGAYNDAYFEHAYLARELGIALVQSADLTVRNNLVYLKTLEGLTRVHVIYRRVDGDYCDSLELRSDSALGIVGLVEAARAGNVAVLNFPGSALIETPAFTPFLPELARRLLGEELQLPAVTTWWCGQELARNEVLSRFDDFALQPVFEPDAVPIEPALLSAEDRAAFKERLLGEPENFVAREKLEPSLAPCLSGDCIKLDQPRFAPEPVVLRVVALWHAGDWVALPGGFARVVGEQSIYRPALHPGNVSKDVWVLAHEDGFGEWPMTHQVTPASASRQDVALRSRTADDLYWLGRYIERLDAGTRQFLSALHRLALGSPSGRAHAELDRLAEALKRTGWISPAVAAAPVDGAMFFDGLLDAAAGGTAMRSCIDGIRRLMLAARDQLSTGMERTLHRLTNTAIERFSGARWDPDQLLEALDAMLATIAAFSGYALDNMTRDAAWGFLDLGKRIERGVAITQSLHGVMTGPTKQMDAGLRLALELCDSTNAYLLRYQREPTFAAAIAFVLTDRENPRALLSQIDRIGRRLDSAIGGGDSPVNRALVPGLVAAVEKFSIENAGADPEEPDLGALFALLDRVAVDLMALSDSITRTFFTHTATPQQMGFSGRSMLLEVGG